MATVKRNKDGVVTHIRIGSKFYTKLDADKINYSDVDVVQFLKKKKHTKEELTRLLFNIINQVESVEQVRINILKANGEISEGIN